MNIVPPGSDLDAILRILASLRWEEDKVLIVFPIIHILVFLWILFVHEKDVLATLTFVSLLTSVYMAENVNEFCRSFIRPYLHHQYFDSHGMFISIMWSLPVLMNTLTILILWLRRFFSLAVQVKRQQLQQKKKE